MLNIFVYCHAKYFCTYQVVGTSGGAGLGDVADDGWETAIPQDLPMTSVIRDNSTTVGLTPEPHLDPWEEHEHLMNPMFLQSPDEIDLPPLDPELLDHQRRRQVGGNKTRRLRSHDKLS